MEIVAIAALVLAMPFLVRGYFRLARRSAARAIEAWPMVERYAHVLLQDRRLDPLIGDMVEAVVCHLGDGRLTRSFMTSALLKRGRRSEDRLAKAMAGLNRQQEEQFLHFLVTALFFDSLTSPVLGVVLRRFLYWLASTAKDRTAPVSRGQVAPAMFAAERMCVAG